MAKQVQSFVEKLRNNPAKMVEFMHDMSHALTTEELEFMLQHSKDTEATEAGATTATEVERINKVVEALDKAKQSVLDGKVNLMGAAEAHLEVEVKF